ncbi:helix-turn-helix domain-containing protein, partial [Bacteroides finegoldii]
MEIKDRIRMIMEREKVPPRVFAETIGVQQSTLSHILNDRNKPSLEVVMKVHQTYSYVNLEWLLYGKGEMLASAESASLVSSNG